MKVSTKFSGVDLGDKSSEVFLADEAGACVSRVKVRTTEAGFRKVFAGMERMVVALEVGTHSPWVSRLLKELGHEVVVANPRQLPLIYRNNSKNDRNDAAILAKLVRVDSGLLSPVEHRSEEDSRALESVKARAVLVRSRTMLLNHVRQVVKSLGQRIPECSAEVFPRRARETLDKRMLASVGGVLTSIEALTVQVKKLDKGIAILEQRYPETKILRQVAGVGPVTALTYRLVVQSPDRFKDSRAIGSYLGLRPRQDQSGDTDKQLRITKAGDPYLRTLLVQSAQYLLGRHGPDTDLRRWGLKLAERGGKSAKKRAIVAVARKLAVLLMVLWKSGEAYEPLRATAGEQKDAA